MTQSSWPATIITLFPELFPGPLGISRIGKALNERKWSLDTVNLREFGVGKHQQVDDTPAGGGPGMVIRADVLSEAIKSVAANKTDGTPLLLLSPRGKPLNQSRVHNLAKGNGIILLCGRFEGVDQRVIDHHQVEEVSIGDYVLAGGEVAAMVLLEAVIRLLPGVMGSDQSALDESFENGLLEYPQYTRPQLFEGMKIPDILTSGHHENVDNWRLTQSEFLTKERRADLWAKYLAEKSTK